MEDLLTPYTFTAYIIIIKVFFNAFLNTFEVNTIVFERTLFSYITQD